MSPLGMAHRSWREQRGLTLVGFAKLAGINVGTFGNAYRYGTNIHPTPWRIRAMMSRISMSRCAVCVSESMRALPHRSQSQVMRRNRSSFSSSTCCLVNSRPWSSVSSTLLAFVGRTGAYIAPGTNHCSSIAVADEAPDEPPGRPPQGHHHGVGDPRLPDRRRAAGGVPAVDPKEKGLPRSGGPSLTSLAGRILPSIAARADIAVRIISRRAARSSAPAG